MVVSKKLRVLLSERTISDLRVKMNFMKKLTQDKQTEIFFDMCNFGINLYIETEQTRFPNRTRNEIMREYYLTQNKSRFQKKIKKFL